MVAEAVMSNKDKTRADVMAFIKEGLARGLSIDDIAATIELDPKLRIALILEFLKHRREAKP
jgi:hypothetical protein